MEFRAAESSIGTVPQVHRVVVAALCREPRQILLCHRSPTRQAFPNLWDFPGGHVEGAEPPRAALAREIFEELGVEVDGAALSERPDLRIRYPDLDLSLWIVRTFHGEPTNLAPHEHDRIEWMTVDAATASDLAHPTYVEWLATAFEI